MAQIDASIPLGIRPMQIESPINALGQVMQLQGVQQQNRLAQMKMDEYGREREDQNALRTALAVPDADPYKVLIGRGRVKEAGEFLKSKTDAEKTSADAQAKKLETAHKRVDMMGQTLGWLRQSPTLENAQQAIQYLVANEIMPPEKAQEAIAKFQADPTPQGIAAFADLGFRAALSTKEQLPKFETRNTGGTTDTLRIDPVSGQARVTNSVQNTQSPDNAASNARQAADNAAARAVQLRGQNLTDARSRESNAANLSKPFEVTGADGRPVLVQQDKAGNITPVQGYTAKSGKPLQAGVLKQLQEVRDNAATINNLSSTFKDEFASKGVLGMGSEASLAAKGVLGSDKESVDWWKNYRKQAELVERHALFGAALTPTEQGSWRSADIGPGMDKDVIKKNLKTRANLAKRVAEFTRQDFIDAGHDPERINQIAGRGEAAAPPAAPPAAKAGAPARISTDAEFNALPPGAEFIGPDGKKRRKP